MLSSRGGNRPGPNAKHASPFTVEI